MVINGDIVAIRTFRKKKTWSQGLHKTCSSYMIDKRVVKKKKKQKQKLYGILHLCLVGNEGMIHNNYQFIQVTSFVPVCVESNLFFDDFTVDI